jgi:hypothetical protein
MIAQTALVQGRVQTQGVLLGQKDVLAGVAAWQRQQAQQASLVLAQQAQRQAQAEHDALAAHQQEHHRQGAAAALLAV